MRPNGWQTTGIKFHAEIGVCLNDGSWYYTDWRDREFEIQPTDADMLTDFYNHTKIEDVAHAWVEGITETVLCPKCGSECHDDATIEDHGCCYDCFQEHRTTIGDECLGVA